LHQLILLTTNLCTYNDMALLLDARDTSVGWGGGQEIGAQPTHPTVLVAPC